MSEKTRTKVLLETGIPTEQLNEVSKKEKNGRPPISEMHYYWSRKPLIVNRGVILASLSDKMDIKTWEKFIINNSNKKDKPLFFKNINSKDPEFEEVLKDAERIYGKNLTILDPFAGGGMIPFEAIRMGLNVEVRDYNPVSYLILKATLEYPKKYGDRLRYGDGDKSIGDKGYLSVEGAINKILKEVKEELSYLYPKHNENPVLAYIWAFHAHCNSCGHLTPLVNNWVLKENKDGKSLWLVPKIENDKLKYDITDNPSKIPESTVSDAEGKCIFCGRKISNSELVKQFEENKMEEHPLAVLMQNSKKERKYELPTVQDVEAYNEAVKLSKNSSLLQYIPDERMAVGTIVAAKYLKTWNNAFNNRQLLLLATMAKKIKNTVDAIATKDPDYAKALGTYLSMWLAKEVDYNSRLTGWHHSIQAIGHSLALRGLGMTWRYAEPNPFEKFSGSLESMKKGVLEGMEFAIDCLKNSGNVEVKWQSILSSNTKDRYKLIITDPPYAEDIPYGELSDFFYVWHKKTVGNLYNFEDNIVDKSEEIDVSRDRTMAVFWSRFNVAVKRLYEILEDDGLLVVFFANKNLEVWENVMNSFRDAGFMITNTIPISTENTNNVIGINKKNIYYSLIITARKRLDNKTGMINDIKEEVRAAIRAKIPDFIKLGYNQGEQLMAAIGVALEKITEYSEIFSFNKNQTAHTALEFAQEFLIEELLKEDWNNVYNGEYNLDNHTTFYLSIMKNKGLNIDYDTFNMYLKAINLNETDLEHKKLIKIEKQKNKKSVKLLDYSQRGDLEKYGEDGIEGNMIIDWVHRLLRDYSIKSNINPVLANTAKNSNIPEKVFLAVLKLILRYGQTYEVENKDVEMAQRFLKSYADIHDVKNLESYDEDFGVKDGK